jgi:general secretion pathway protein E
MAKQWFISKNGTELGPFVQADIARMIQDKKFLPTDFIRTEESTQWHLASKVKGLFPANVPPVVPPPIRTMPVAAPMAAPPTPPPITVTAAPPAPQQPAGTLLSKLWGKPKPAPSAKPAVKSQKPLSSKSGLPPVARLVEVIFSDAVKARASDIHIQPTETELIVRFRVDGTLFDKYHLPKNLQGEVTNRIKVFGKMDIANRNIPQDGRGDILVEGRTINLRIATLPSDYGERVVMRLLDKNARLITLEELGMDEANLERFRRIVHLEHGLILVTGPTGSGKSTTLYAALQSVNKVERNIITLEDPIEYRLEGISQTQIHEKKGLTFAQGLRNILRQDPDIIMIGEIRDQETAGMATQAAMTGHLVFSTLHTNDAVGAIPRLQDLGVEPHKISNSLVAVLAQRLVRQVCPQCVSSYQPAEKELFRLGISDSRQGCFLRGVGCEHCHQSGYYGRLGLYELLTVEPSVGNLIQSQSDTGSIQKEAVKHGMRTLREDGIDKVLAGLTTIEELDRVTAQSFAG